MSVELALITKLDIADMAREISWIDVEFHVIIIRFFTAVFSVTDNTTECYSRFFSV